MADLTNAKIANTYKDLLQVNAETSNAGLDGTLRTIQDGGGTASPIAMSTAQLNVTGQFALGGTVLTATADELNDLADAGRLDTLTAGDDTVKITVGGVSVSTATVSATVVVNPVLSLTEVDAATGSFNTQVSATNFIAGTGSFTTKVSGVAAEFSGNVSAANVYASTNIFVGGTAVPSAAAITSINAAHTSTNNALVAASAALATSIGTANTRITSVSDFAVALSATLAASIGTTNTRIAQTSADLATSIGTTNTRIAQTSTDLATSIGTANTRITSVSNFAVALSATMATSIGNRTAAITSVNAVIAAVSALTSVNKAAITSINAGTFNSLDVETSVQIGDFINLDGKVLTITGDTDDTFKITAGANGATTLEAVDTAGELGTITLNADGRIFLDAGDTYGGVYFEKTGTSYAAVFTAGTVVGFQNLIDDGSLKFQGFDSGSTITALDLQMANAGKAIFNAGATFADAVTVEDISLDGKVLTITGDTGDTFKITSGTDGATTLATVDTAAAAADLTLDVDGVIKLDGGNGFGSTFLQNNGTLYGSLFNSGNDFILRNKIVNGDISFQSQGGSVTALTLDMSAAGLATFNDGATFNGDVTLTGAANNVVWDKSDNALEFTDNAKAIFGTGGDLQIFHDGSNSYITEGGTGSFIVRTNRFLLRNPASNEDMIDAVADGAVRVALYYDNSAKLATTATGATVTGGIVADSATVDDISLDGKVLTITGDTDDTFTITSGANGATTLRTTDTAGSSGTLTLASDGMIDYNAGDTYGQHRFFGAGTMFTTLMKSSGNSGTDFMIRNNMSDGDLLFAGSDGGSGITGLKLDMSEAGKAIFNAGATFADDVTVTGVATATSFAGSGAGLTAGTTPLTTLDIDGATDIGEAITDSDLLIIDNGAGGTNRKTAASRLKTYISAGSTVALDDIITGDAASTLATSAGNITIDAQGTDTDIIFKGTDGGVDTTFLTLDGSAAGTATFNNDLTVNGGFLKITGAGNKSFHVESTDAIASMELGGTTGAFIDLKRPFSDDFDIRFGSGGAGGFLQVASGQALTISDNVGGTLATFADGDSVDLYHNHSKKFETTAAGATVTGGLTADSATIDDISLDGKVLTITGDTGDTFSIIAGAAGASTIATVDAAGASGHLTLDADGVISLDAGDGDGQIQVKAAGTEYVRLFNSGSHAYIRSTQSDGNIYFQGNDGGSYINALTLDMSEAGKAIFNAGATFANNVELADNVKLTLGATADVHNLLELFHDGTNSILRANAAPLWIQTDDTIKITKDNGTEAMAFFIGDGAVELYHNASKKIETTATGATVTGAIVADSATVDDISLDGKVITIVGDSGDTFTATTGANGATVFQTIDSAAAAGHITLDADGYVILDGGDDNGHTILKNKGTSYATFLNSGSDFWIRQDRTDGDILFKGSDGGSAITALTLDMSDAGTATFNHDIIIADLGYIGSASDPDAIQIAADGVTTFSQKVVIDGGIDVDNFHIDGDTISRDAAGSGNMTLDAAGDINFDANGGDLIFKDNAVEIGRFTNSSTDLVMQVTTQDKDIVFKGDDGGSAITALTLDMSEAGTATFNHDIIIADLGYIGSASLPTAIRISASGNLTVAKDIYAMQSVRIATDGYALQFGGDGEIDIIHDHNSGLILRNSETGDVGGFVLTLQTGEQDVVTGDVLGTIDFQAFGESSGSDAILVAAGIEAVAEQSFNATQNTTRLKFKTAVSETATEKMTLTGAGNLGIGITAPLKTLHVDGPALSTVQTLTDASTVTSDFDTGQNFTLTLAGNRTLGAPSNVDAGQVGSIFIIQDGTGSRTLAYNSIWKFAGGTAPVLSTAAGAIDRLDYIVQSGTAIQALLTKAYA